jgi:hypothetical protein
LGEGVGASSPQFRHHPSRSRRSSGLVIANIEPFKGRHRPGDGISSAEYSEPLKGRYRPEAGNFPCSFGFGLVSCWLPGRHSRSRPPCRHHSYDPRGKSPPGQAASRQACAKATRRRRRQRDRPWQPSCTKVGKNASAAVELPAAPGPGRNRLKTFDVATKTIVRSLPRTLPGWGEGGRAAKCTIEQL